MKLFLDSADIDQIKKAQGCGLIDGVTTNPSLMKKALENRDVSMEEYIWSILQTMGDKPVSLEVEGGDAQAMYNQGKALYSRFSRPENTVVIKIPIDPTIDPEKHMRGEGFKVIKRLSSEGIPVNVTLIFTPEQALLAAKAGAAYVSPFVGRIDDKIRSDAHIHFDKKDYFPSYGWLQDGNNLEDNGIISGIHLLESIVDIFEIYHIKTEVLAASLRSSRQVRECALVGADVATVPFDVIEQMLYHPKTEEGMQKFIKDIPKIYDELMK